LLSEELRSHPKRTAKAVYDLVFIGTQRAFLVVFDRKYVPTRSGWHCALCSVDE
jgi:hypothetical protein